MSKIVQEKFEVRYSKVPEGTENTGWVSDKTARVKKHTPGREAKYGDVCDLRHSTTTFYNALPPGMDIEDQEVKDVRQMQIITSGASDISADAPDLVSVKRGFIRRYMSPTDDMYTREHHDAFYDEIKMETEDGTNIGFIERNNMLDRM